MPAATGGCLNAWVPEALPLVDHGPGLKWYGNERSLLATLKSFLEHKVFTARIRLSDPWLSLPQGLFSSPVSSGIFSDSCTKRH